MNRELIWSTLFARLEALTAFQETDRKLKHWDSCENMPAMYLTQGAESVVKTGRGLPNIYTMSGEIYLYVRNESNGTPATQINELLDLVQAMMEPTHPDGKITLGGLVDDVWIEGSIDRDEGVLGDIGVAIIPIKILTT